MIRLVAPLGPCMNRDKCWLDRLMPLWNLGWGRGYGARQCAGTVVLHRRLRGMRIVMRWGCLRGRDFPHPRNRLAESKNAGIDESISGV